MKEATDRIRAEEALFFEVIDISTVKFIGIEIMPEFPITILVDGKRFRRHKYKISLFKSAYAYVEDAVHNTSKLDYEIEDVRSIISFERGRGNHDYQRNRFLIGR